MLEDSITHDETNKQPIDFYLISAQRAYGICCAPECDRPICLWCTRCHAKTCAHHARVVQYLPDYHPATLCWQCQESARYDELDSDPAALTIRRPDYDPTEATLSEGHMSWWLACSIERYIKMLATHAPDLMLDTEATIIVERAAKLQASRERGRSVPEGVAFLASKLQESGKADDDDGEADDDGEERRIPRTCGHAPPEECKAWCVHCWRWLCEECSDQPQHIGEGKPQ